MVLEVWWTGHSRHALRHLDKHQHHQMLRRAVLYRSWRHAASFALLIGPSHFDHGVASEMITQKPPFDISEILARIPVSLRANPCSATNMRLEEAGEIGRLEARLVGMTFVCGKAPGL